MLLAALALLLAAPANATAQITAAKPGDVVQFAPGVYPRIMLKSVVKAAPGVTVDMTAPGVQPSQFDLYLDAGLTFIGGDFKGSGLYGYSVNQASTRITIRGGVFEDATLAGVSVVDGTYVEVSGNVFRNPSDGIDLVNVHFGQIARNTQTHLGPIIGHPDCVQAWNSAGQPVVSDLDIGWNTCVGNIQGYGQGSSATGAARVALHDNVVVTSMYWAGGWNGCSACSMTNNIAAKLPNTPPGTVPSWVMTAPAGQAVPAIAGNQNAAP